ncbi:MAG: sigma 54-interacting transcriptional regulator [Acidobacteriota bacterium]
MTDSPEQLTEALDRLDAGRSSDEDQRRVRAGLRDALAELDALRGTTERQRRTLLRTVAILRAQGLEPVAESVLDIVVSLTGAERGFVAVCPFGETTEEPTGDWRFLAARELARKDLDDPDSLVSTTIIRRVLRSREAVVTTDALQSNFKDAASVKSLKLRSVACLPIVPEGGMIGFIYLDNTTETDTFDEAAMDTVRAILPVAAEAVYRALAEEDASVEGFPEVITCSEAFKGQLARLRQAAAGEVPVLLCGPTGTGKTLLARQVHEASPRADKPFIHVNSGAIPESLIEAELFGVVRGAYTGAERSRAGLFEAADGGTLYLDELQALPPACQVKLLLALEERKVTRVGSTEPVEVDVRVIASLDRDPEQAMAEGALRADLHYRLAVLVAHVPPLAERAEDIPLLAQAFLKSSRQRLGSRDLHLGRAALQRLLDHDWPGNVRELQNVLERAALLTEGDVIEDIEVTAKSPGWSGRILGRRPKVDLDEFQRVWEECGGRSSVVAERLGIHPKSVPRIRRRLQGK